MYQRPETRDKRQETRDKRQETRDKRQGKIVPEISVIVITRNRPHKLLHCLQTLSHSSFQNFEVVIVDQSDSYNIDPQVQECLKHFGRFHYIQSKRIGKSRGLNQAITASMASLLAFTDDDCIPDVNWLRHIIESFSVNPQVVGVFGKTIGYQSYRHKGYFCLATFENKNSRTHIITQPSKHSDWIGIGNNMAFRKSVFEELGGFKEWLGPGSIGSNAEDAEITLRTLIARKTLLYNPKVLIAHDRWVTLRESNVQELSYLCGEIACYGYLALHGNRFAQRVLNNNLREILYSEPRQIIYFLTHLKKYAFSLSFWWLLKILARLRGVLIAIFFFLLSSDYLVKNYSNAHLTLSKDVVYE